MMASAKEGTPLIDAKTASSAAMAASGVFNQAAEKYKKAKVDGPLTFRMLGFLGGWAMIISNGLGIVDRFFSFNFPGALIAFWEVLFGVLIVMLEMPSLWCFKASKMNGGVRMYAKFLEYTWGRGVLYFFCGSLQVTNFNMLDWAVGGFMMFVGVTAIIAGIATAKGLRLFKFSVKGEADLKEKWAKYDANGDGQLDVKELTLFIKESDVDMNRNEIAATYMSLDKNFDEKITFEEMFYWWKTADERGNTASMSV